MKGAGVHLWRPVYFLRFCWVQGTGQPREKPQRIETRTSASRCLQAGRQASHRKNPSLVRDGLLQDFVGRVPRLGGGRVRGVSGGRLLSTITRSKEEVRKVWQLEKKNRPSYMVGGCDERFP